MELTQLRQFCLAARSGNITKSAAELHISQPALSNAIARLEAELGVHLFTRTGNRIVLNPSGALFLSYVESGITSIDEGAVRVKELNNILTASVSYSIPNGGLLTSVRQRFMSAHPNIKFNQYTLSSEQSRAFLLQGVLDFAISFSRIRDTRIEWQKMAETQICLLSGAGNHFAESDTVRLRDLAEQVFVTNTTSQDLIEIFSACCGRAGFVPRVIFSGDEPRMLDRIIRETNALMVIPMLQLEGEPLMEDSSAMSWLHLRPLFISDEDCKVDMGIAHCRDLPLSKYAASFYDYLISSLLS